MFKIGKKIIKNKQNNLKLWIIRDFFKPFWSIFKFNFMYIISIYTIFYYIIFNFFNFIIFFFFLFIFLIYCFFFYFFSYFSFISSIFFFLFWVSVLSSFTIYFTKSSMSLGISFLSIF